MTRDRSDIQSQIQRLAHNGLVLAIGGVIAQLAFTLLEILVARNLGAEAYGTFVTAYAWTVLGGFLMELGTPLWTIQEGSRQRHRLPSLLGAGLTVNLIMFILLYLLIAAVAATVSPNAVLSLLLVVLPYGLILAVQNNLAAVFSSYQTMQVNALFQGLAPVVILLLYAIQSAWNVTLTGVGLAYVIGGGVVTGVWFLHTLRRVRPHVTARNIGHTLRSSYQYGLTGILGHVYYKADIIMLSAIAGLREAGIYAAAFKLVELVHKVAVLSGRVFAPAIFKASHESEKTFQLLSSMMIRFLAIVGLMAGVATFVLAEELILLLFGENFAASVPVLRVLGGVMAARCMMIALQLLLSSIDLHFERVVGLGIAVAVHIASNALLIPAFGAQGAAWSAVVSGSLLIVLYAFASARRRTFRFVRWLLLPSALAVSIVAAARVTDTNVFVTAIAAVSAFIASLYATGLIHRQEVGFVFRSIGGSKG